MIERKTLWSRLKGNTRTVGGTGKTFMELFSEYNRSIGGSLVELSEQPQDIQGRDKEINRLLHIMERPITPIAMLVGKAGIGKTALMEQFVKNINAGKVNGYNEHEYLVIALRLGLFSSLEPNVMRSALADLLTNMKWIEDFAQQADRNKKIRVILFIDEIHMIVSMFGSGTKIGGDVFKDILARSPVRVVTATTRNEFDTTIAVDEPFKERFKTIEMQELHPDIVFDICRNWWRKVVPYTPPPADDIFRYIIETNRTLRSASAEPRKTLDILEDCVAYTKIDKKPVTKDVVHEIYYERFSIGLELDVQVEDVMAEIRRRLIGQDEALATLYDLLDLTFFDIERGKKSNKPLMTIMMTGPTGVGKSETVKAIASVLYPGRDVIFNMDMPYYNLPESDAEFRQVLGERLLHEPNSVILLDEIEKGHRVIHDSLLAILDEGIVRYKVKTMEGNYEPREAPIRNAIVCATTNKGHQVFDLDAKYTQSSKAKSEAKQKAEYDTLNETIRRYLIDDGFRTEMLNRFTHIIPYRGLDDDTLLTITERSVDAMIKDIEDDLNIEIVTNAPVYWDIYRQTGRDFAIHIARVKAKSNDPSSGGARRLKSFIQQEIYLKIARAYRASKRNGVYGRRFKLEVSRDAKIYNHSAPPTQGGVIVYEID